MKHFQGGQGNGHVFSAEVMDMEGKYGEIAFFNLAAIFNFEKIEEGRVYDFIRVATRQGG